EHQHQRRALQSPLEDRDLLSGDQAVAAHQIVHWHQRKCRHDPNMDGPDYDSYPESLESDGQTLLVSVEPGGIYPLKFICLDFSVSFTLSCLSTQSTAE